MKYIIKERTISSAKANPNLVSPLALLIQNDDEGNNISTIITMQCGKNIPLQVDNDDINLKKPALNRKTFSIYYRTNYSSATTKNTKAGFNIKASELPELSVSGLTFLGWYDENDNKMDTSKIIMDNMILTAKWEAASDFVISNLNSTQINSIGTIIISGSASGSASMKAKKIIVKNGDTIVDTIDLTSTISSDGIFTYNYQNDSLKTNSLSFIPQWTGTDDIQHNGTSDQATMPMCFPAGSRIIVGQENGEYITKCIENITTNDYILCRDLDLNTDVFKRVRLKFNPLATHKIVIKFNDGTNLTTSMGHPLYTTVGWKSYAPHILPDGSMSNALQVGDILRKVDGTTKSITEIKAYNKFKIKMYSMEMYDIHNFYVDNILAYETTITNKNYSAKGFDGTTQVLTDLVGTNSKQLSTISPNETVAAVNIFTNEKSIVDVTDSSNNIVNTIANITLSDNNIIKIGLGQMVFTTCGWKNIVGGISDNENFEIGCLMVGDELYKIDDTTVTITNISYETGDKILYKLDVNDLYNTYFTYSIIAHNAIALPSNKETALAGPVKDIPSPIDEKEIIVEEPSAYQWQEC